MPTNPHFLVVRCAIGELEQKLNEAARDGYRIRETLFVIPEPPGLGTTRPEEQVFHYLLERAPDAGAEMAKAMRQMMTAMGMGDRLPPEPKDASVLTLVPRKKKKKR